MNYSYSLFQDWKANKGNLKGRTVMVLFRLAHLATYNRFIKILMIPYLIFYRVMVEWFLGIELQFPVVVGRGLVLWHGQGSVIHKSTKIGSNCVLRQNTTIGNKKNLDGTKSAGAIIGDNVDIGAHVIIIGSIHIASNCTIGAGSVVTKSVDKAATIVGNPARVLRYSN
ncbi:serine acetyltransferase [Algoriphagus sp.]|uniref:serine acetyltransferase n=1 Tax=Algoriphagus sp. TaxID=1872435 RepID=UPI003F730748